MSHQDRLEMKLGRPATSGDILVSLGIAEPKSAGEAIRKRMSARRLGELDKDRFRRDIRGGRPTNLLSQVRNAQGVVDG